MPEPEETEDLEFQWSDPRDYQPEDGVMRKVTGSAGGSALGAAMVALGEILEPEKVSGGDPAGRRRARAGHALHHRLRRPPATDLAIPNPAIGVRVSSPGRRSGIGPELGSKVGFYGLDQLAGVLVTQFSQTRGASGGLGVPLICEAA